MQAPTRVRSEVAQEMLVIQQEIGAAMRLSYQSITIEPLPEEIAMLLMRMAMAEVLRNAVEEELAQPAA